MHISGSYTQGVPIQYAGPICLLATVNTGLRAYILSGDYENILIFLKIIRKNMSF